MAISLFNPNARAIQNTLDINHNRLNRVSLSLATGHAINGSQDGPADLQTINALTRQIRGMAIAARNTQNGISLLQVAEGATNELTEILLRMKDLATAAADASASEQNRRAAQAEYDSLGKEMANIVKNSAAGGDREDRLLRPNEGKLAKGPITFQIGASSEETMTVDFSKLIADMDASFKSVSGEEGYTGPGGGNNNRIALADDITIADDDDDDDDNGGGTKLGKELLTAKSANEMIAKLEQASQTIDELRARFGGTDNRMEHTRNNLTNMSSQSENALSRYRDVDFASATTDLSQLQVLMQSGMTVLRSGNQWVSSILSLIQ